MVDLVGMSIAPAPILPKLRSHCLRSYLRTPVMGNYSYKNKVRHCGLIPLGFSLIIDARGLISLEEL